MHAAYNIKTAFIALLYT